MAWSSTDCHIICDFTLTKWLVNTVGHGPDFIFYPCRGVCSYVSHLLLCLTLRNIIGFTLYFNPAVRTVTKSLHCPFSMHFNFDSLSSSDLTLHTFFYSVLLPYARPTTFPFTFHIWFVYSSVKSSLLEHFLPSNHFQTYGANLGIPLKILHWYRT